MWRWIAAGAALATGAVLYFALRVYTPAIDEEPRKAGRSIASLEEIELGGSKQWILIRGRDRRAPIVLFLHGGPGMPMMYLAYAFQRPLEDDFLTVQWDRLGAGKSYSGDIDKSKMRLSREIADTIALIEKLRTRFGDPKVILVGHSYGTTLGALVAARRPDLLWAYVGVGQVACDSTTDHRLQDGWLTNEARRAGDGETASLAASGKPYDRESALFRYGGELAKHTSFLYLMGLGLRAPEYSLIDGWHVKSGVAFTHATLKNDVYRGALMDALPALAVPVYFLEGRRDFTAPSACAVQYLERLKAPHKTLIWFDGSAHFPFLEEPEKFHSVMKRVAVEGVRAGEAR